MTLSDFEIQLNEWGQQRVPFLFLIDFEMNKPQAFRLDGLNHDEILYNFNGLTNLLPTEKASSTIQLNPRPLTLAQYKEKFDHVYHHLFAGDTYLANLTIKTPIEIDLSLREIFHRSSARYKLLYKDQFLVFSPEIFVQIYDSKIFSFPMKGTIDADVEGARERILSDQKELAEHVTIVDLIRNDLSNVAENVTVTKFRYVEKIITNNKTLLQVSSEVAGDLEEPFARIGSILLKLLPAGSVSGAPKRKTIEILRTAENEDRGYYTGVTGIFDGNKLDSGVMIRFIEEVDGKKFYRSGGGITAKSSFTEEYKEAIDKIYVPVN